MSQEIGKSPDESAIVTFQIMMPANSNPAWIADNDPDDENTQGHLELGAVNGGAILNLIDNVAGLAALRHCRSKVVTASIDKMNFVNPVHVGELLILKASVNYVGNTSLEVGVRVETENLWSGKVSHTGNAYLTFVNLNNKGKPKKAPPLVLKTEDDKRRHSQAMFRLAQRKETRRKQRDSNLF